MKSAIKIFVIPYVASAATFTAVFMSLGIPLNLIPTSLIGLGLHGWITLVGQSILFGLALTLPVHLLFGLPAVAVLRRTRCAGKLTYSAVGVGMGVAGMMCFSLLVWVGSSGGPLSKAFAQVFGAANFTCGSLAAGAVGGLCSWYNARLLT